MSEEFAPADDLAAGSEAADPFDAEVADPDPFEADDFDAADVVDAFDSPAEPRMAEAEWEPTGDPRVDDAVARLADLPGLPVDEHVAVFDEVARRLHDALAGIAPDS